MRDRYDRPTPRRAAKKSPARAVRPAVRASPVRSPARMPHIPSSHAESLAARRKHHDVEGLQWTIFEGVEVLQLGDSNYLAVPDERHTFTIVRIEPRTEVLFRLKSKELLEYIKRLIQRDLENKERELEYERKKEVEKAEKNRWEENQPGFYVTPGEEDPEDRENLLPIGPFWRFELTDPRYTAEDINDDRFGDDDVEDWALEAWKAEQEKPVSERQPVTIVEARNLREAKAGNGYVWWKNGVFKGPPVDPRQIGFDW